MIATHRWYRNYHYPTNTNYSTNKNSYTEHTQQSLFPDRPNTLPYHNFSQHKAYYTRGAHYE